MKVNLAILNPIELTDNNTIRCEHGITLHRHLNEFRIYLRIEMLDESSGRTQRVHDAEIDAEQIQDWLKLERRARSHESMAHNLCRDRLLGVAKVLQLFNP